MEKCFNGLCGYISNELEKVFNVGFLWDMRVQVVWLCDDSYLQRDISMRGSSNFRYVFLPALKFLGHKSCAIDQPV
jgi:hypothetical protein